MVVHRAFGYLCCLGDPVHAGCPEAVAGEFIQMAMMFNQSADELIKTPYGSRLYNQILSRRQEESCLDRVVARVFGDPIEIEEDKTKKETVSANNVSE